MSGEGRRAQSDCLASWNAARGIGLSTLVTLVTVSVVGILFGALAVILAIPAASAVETLIDVLFFGHDPPEAPPRRAHSLRLGRPNRTSSG